MASARAPALTAKLSFLIAASTREVYEILSGDLHLREAMRPYLRELMTQAHADGQPVMRGVFHEFPDDPTCWDLPDQYMFGPDLLVAPVLEPHATSRRVYLPAGASWSDLHDGRKHDGGQWVEVAAPLHTIPVFRRDGARPELAGLLTP